MIERIHIGNVSDLAEVSDYIYWTDTDGPNHFKSLRGHVRSLGWKPLVIRILQALEG